jgi:hypothetical protein
VVCNLEKAWATYFSSRMKLHAETGFSAWELEKTRISNIEQGISNARGRHRCRSAFSLLLLFNRDHGILSNKNNIFFHYTGCHEI